MALKRFKFDIASGEEVGAFASLAQHATEATTVIAVQPRSPSDNPAFTVTVEAGGDDERRVRTFLGFLVTEDDPGHFTEEDATPAPA